MGIVDRDLFAPAFLLVSLHVSHDTLSSELQEFDLATNFGTRSTHAEKHTHFTRRGVRSNDFLRLFDEIYVNLIVPRLADLR